GSTDLGDTTQYASSIFSLSAEEMKAATLEAFRDSILIGDLNGDDKITAKDTALLKRYVAGAISLDFLNSLAADTNGDGKITSKDISVLKSILAGAR
ncbi:MAG: dockerin type I repeat-containing protein, partial [Clostridia bacterium]|nr:dockerin type I repeat-containing protein [Clostridia bacterium]